MYKSVSFIRLSMLFFCSLLACKNNPTVTQTAGPSPARTPAEERASFVVESGLDVQLVASEPLVQDPVVITFDPDGRLWVVEMRGFMPDIEGRGEDQPVGRVSVLEDTNGDGRMDVSTIYLDSLVMPRALAVVAGGALIAENGALWLTQDRNGDLRADTKTLLDSSYAGSKLPEHAGNGLWRGMDNWYYNAKSRLRYRLFNGQWQRDSTEFRGQWGISHDNAGRLYYNYNWSQLHADLVPPNYLSRNPHHTPTTGIDQGLTLDRRIYPIRPTPAVNRGYIPGTLDKQSRLQEFTAACSPLYYRGTAFSADYEGNVFVCEPAGNLIKRNVLQENGLALSARDPSPGREFLASTDERFRPVHLTTGPDGALYVADMYRGLIQHGAYITPYLREQTLSRNLVQPIHYGRIWRVVPKQWKAPKSKPLSRATSSELVAYLSHADGWYRDVAQRLLVERNDQTSKSALVELALHGKNPLGRVHALWTLQGMQAAQAEEVLFPLLSDPHTLVRVTALRLLEPMAQTDPAIRSKLATALAVQRVAAPPELILQMALTAGVLDQPAAEPLLAGIIEQYDSSALIRDAVLSSLSNGELAFLRYLWQSEPWQTRTPSREIFLEMLATVLIRRGEATELQSLWALLDASKSPFGWREKAVLTGLSMGSKDENRKPIPLHTQPAVLSRARGNLVASRLQILATLFEWPGHAATVRAPEKKFVLTPDEQKLFALGRQHYLSTCAGCHGTDGAGLNRFAPPLIGSEWVLGNEKRLALILLHGMEGPVDVAGKVYKAPDILPVMPAHSTLDDGTITAILTYIRNEWGNDAGPVDGRTVGTTRVTSQGRVVPWTTAELNKYVEETKAEAGK